MQSSREIHNLLIDLVDDLNQVSIQWQLASLLTCLLLAWVITRLIRSQVPAQQGAWQVGLAGVNRIIFPLTALVLVLVTKAVLQRWQHVSVLNIAVPLLVSLALVRLAVYMLRRIFVPSGWLHTSERFVAILVWSGVALHITGFLPEILAALEAFSFNAGKYKISLLTVLSGLLSVAVTMLVALWLAATLEKRLMGKEQMDLSLRVVLAKFLRAALLITGVLVALPLAGRWASASASACKRLPATT